MSPTDCSASVERPTGIEKNEFRSDRRKGGFSGGREKGPRQKQGRRFHRPSPARTRSRSASRRGKKKAEGTRLPGQPEYGDGFRGCRTGNGFLNDERLLIYRSLSKDNLGIGLLSHVKMRSIMGDEALNFRVRNGIGCTRFSMDTKEIFQNI